MGEEVKGARAGAKVTVACKLPGGLILRLFKMEEHSEPVLGGGSRTVKQSHPIEGAQVRINGNAVAHGKAPRHAIVLDGAASADEGAPFTDGYALTLGVDKEFWDAWLEQNKNSDLVRNRIVFARGSTADAEAQALEQIKVRTNLEPLLQDKDPRAPKRIQRASRDKVDSAAA